MPVIGACFLLNVFIRDHGLVRKEEKEAAASQDETPAPEMAEPDPEKGEMHQTLSKDDQTLPAGNSIASPASPAGSRKASTSSEKSTFVVREDKLPG